MNAPEDFKVITEGVGTRIISYVSEYQGKNYFNIRKQYKKKGSDDWNFTKDGIAVPLDERKSLARISRAAKEAALSIFGE